MPDEPSAPPPGPPLTGLRVVDLSSWIAGAYCTKLLADAGADVVKVEPPAGDPLRRWSASGTTIDPGADGPLFDYLAASKRSVVVDPADDDALDELLADADVAVWSGGRLGVPGTSFRTPDALRGTHPHLIVTAISPYGLDTPWEGRPATEFTLQAWSGGIIRLARGRPDRSPTYVGGQTGEWMAGLYAAIGTLAARSTGANGRLVDVSMLEALGATLTYHPVTFMDIVGKPIRVDRFVPTPGVSEASDGMVGLGTGTGQQWHDFCAMIGRPEWIEEPSYLKERTMLAPEIDAWVAEHTVAEVLDLATAFRLPNAPIVNGANATETDHLVERQAFTTNPRDGAVNPGPPYRFESVRLRTPEPAPALGASKVGDGWTASARVAPSAPRDLPFAGLRVLDMTSFWAGPLTGHLLAMLGAEVLHLESPKRPDGARYVGGVPQSEPDWLERSPVFSSVNTDKLGLAIDAGSEAGGALVRRLLATCDVLVENYTPRVLDHLGLDPDELRAENPGLITVRMPGFGLDGPWRDVAAFAYVIEDASGLTWLSGHPDVPPIEPYCLGDPNAGLHALFGLQLALAHRERTGEGGLVEAAMIEAALNITAEQVIEHSAHGELLMRSGNRGPLAAPQNVYQVTGVDDFGQEDNWVAIAVATDEQWQALVRVLDEPDWATDPALVTADGRRAHHDAIDAELGAWCRDRSADEVVQLLWGAGVPVAPVAQPHHQVDLAPMQGRRFFEEIDHPISGRSRSSTLPIAFSDWPDRWHRQHAPLLGQHTDEVLRGIGVTDDELAQLRADGVIG